MEIMLMGWVQQAEHRAVFGLDPRMIATTKRTRLLKLLDISLILLSYCVVEFSVAPPGPLREHPVVVISAFLCLLTADGQPDDFASFTRSSCGK